MRIADRVVVQLTTPANIGTPHDKYNLISQHGSLGGQSLLQFLQNFRRGNSEFNQMEIPENLTLKLVQ